MRHLRDSIGTQAILSHHALQTPVLERTRFIYDELEQLGPPIAFQTESPIKLDWAPSIRNGIDVGADSIELWSDVHGKFGLKYRTPQELKDWATWFRKRSL